MNRDYVGYVLAVVSIIIGGFVSWYYYDKSVQFKRPIFNADFIPQVVYDAKREVRIPLKVTREDGSPLTKSVYSANHVFWNAGNVPVVAQDVLTPIRISISNPENEILSTSVALQSRKVVECKVTPDGTNAFVITFRILEQDDGCMVNVFYSGVQGAKYEVLGEIVGVKKIEARTETAWELIERDHQNAPMFRSLLQYAIAFIPWITALLFSGALLLAGGATRAKRIRVVTGLIVATALYVVAVQANRQYQVIDSPPSISTKGWAALNTPALHQVDSLQLFAISSLRRKFAIKESIC